MVVRGYLAFDDQNRLVAIDSNADDPNNPDPSEIIPVPFDALEAQSADVENLDANQLTSDVDANQNGITNLSEVSTGNVSLNSVTGDGLPAQAIEHGKAWADDGQLYDTIQGAVDAGSSLVLVGPGTFSENVNINVANMTVVGSGRDSLVDGGTDSALSLDADGVLVKNFAVKTTAGGGNNARGVDMSSLGDEQQASYIWVEECDEIGIRQRADESILTNVWCDSANIDGNDVQVFGTGCIADDIHGSVTDSGTGTAVGETA